MPKKLCWKLPLAGWSIALHQTGKDQFVVTYGVEVHKGDYEYAARKIGECIMHSLACEGKLDNREKGEA